jgi:dTDP-4-amino-4,6-dideoxygalactose transaminase
VKTPLVDLHAAYAEQSDALRDAILEVAESCGYINGPAVAEFEARFAQFTGAAHAVGVASGTAALVLALRAAGVGPGQRVATSPHTFMATAEAIVLVGAEPTFVDVDEDTGNLSPSQLESRMEDVHAIVPVHLYGLPADMHKIMKLSEAYGVPVVEDAAQAHGAAIVEVDGTPRAAGTFGQAGCFSFYPGKNLGAMGDAGAVISDDTSLAARVRRLRDHGRSSKYEHQEIGYGERLDTLQAAILNVRLTRLADWTTARRQCADIYSEALKGVGDLRLPFEPDGFQSAYHLYVMRTGERDRLLAHLNDAGIQAGIHYPVPLHLQPAFEFMGMKAGSMPSAERWANECVSLPIYPQLSTNAQDRIVDSIQAFFG